MILSARTVVPSLFTREVQHLSVRHDISCVVEIRCIPEFLHRLFAEIVSFTQPRLFDCRPFLIDRFAYRIIICLSPYFLKFCSQCIAAVNKVGISGFFSPSLICFHALRNIVVVYSLAQIVICFFERVGFLNFPDPVRQLRFFSLHIEYAGIDVGICRRERKPFFGL